MSSRIAALSLAANDPDRIAAFWQAARSWVQIFRDETGVDLAIRFQGWCLRSGGSTDDSRGRGDLHLIVCHFLGIGPGIDGSPTTMSG